MSPNHTLLRVVIYISELNSPSIFCICIGLATSSDTSVGRKMIAKVNEWDEPSWCQYQQRTSNNSKFIWQKLINWSSLTSSSFGLSLNFSRSSSLYLCLSWSMNNHKLILMEFESLFTHDRVCRRLTTLAVIVCGKIFVFFFICSHGCAIIAQIKIIITSWAILCPQNTEYIGKVHKGKGTGLMHTYKQIHLYLLLWWWLHV